MGCMPENREENWGLILINPIYIPDNGASDVPLPYAEFDIMQSRWLILGEGASTPYHRPAPALDPVLVVCLIWGVRMTPELVQEIYRVALERSRAAFRPSMRELAQRVCLN